MALLYNEVELYVSVNLRGQRSRPKPCLNEDYFRHSYSKIANLEPMAWSCYIENCIFMRHVEMRLKI